MTYTQLKADIAAYMHRTDLTAVIPNFIATAEATLFRELNLKDMDVQVSGTSTGALIDLPSDFGTVSRLTVTENGLERNVDYIARPDSAIGTSVVGYSQESGKLRLFPSVDGVAYTLYYNPLVQSLSDGVTTNWLLTNAADLYLYASCYEAAKWIRDDEEAAKLMQVIPPLLDSVRRFSERKAISSRANLQIKVRR